MVPVSWGRRQSPDVGEAEAWGANAGNFTGTSRPTELSVESPRSQPRLAPSKPVAPATELPGEAVPAWALLDA